MERKTVTLYLEGWQKRMIRDYMKDFDLRLKKLIVIIEDRRQWVMYRQPQWEMLKEGAWQLYLTDSQVAMVSEVMGLKEGLSAVQVSPELIENGSIVMK